MLNLNSQLEDLARRIDKIDTELIEILSRRMGPDRGNWKIKRDNNITILQLKRWSNIVQDRLNKAIDSGLNTRIFFTSCLRSSIHESIKRQEELIRKEAMG